MQIALTIAGSDSSGGAGIQADLRTFQAHGVFGASAITAITAQNTTGVRDIMAVAPSLVVSQIDAVADDLPVAAVKIGMLATAAIASAVADTLTRRALPNIVLDPVMVAKGGDALLSGDAVETMRTSLLPLAALITPNLPEAEVLLGLSPGAIHSVEDMTRAAHALRAMGARAVVVKGGHLTGDPANVAAADNAPDAIDVLVDADGRVITIANARLATRHTHGTGCTFASAIAARLANGDTLADAVRGANAYVQRAIQRAPGFGRGHGPLGLGL